MKKILIGILAIVFFGFLPIFIRAQEAPPPPSVPPGIKVVSPNGGEKWATGGTYEIKWQITGDISKVSIVLYKGTKVFWIAQNIPADQGFLSWKITDIDAGNNYYIGVFKHPWDSQKTDNVVDYSDRPFSIKSSKPTPTPEPTGPLGNLHGIVYYKNKSVSASVQLDGKSTLSWNWFKRGYQFTKIKPGTYTISATYKKIKTTESIIILPGDNQHDIIIPAKEEKPEIKTASLFGDVRNQNQKPISDAKVSIGSLGEDTTDSAGHFEIQGIPPGTSYSVSVSAKDYRPMTETVELKKPEWTYKSFTLHSVTTPEGAIVSAEWDAPPDTFKALEKHTFKMTIKNTGNIRGHYTYFPQQDWGDLGTRTVQLNLEETDSWQWVTSFASGTHDFRALLYTSDWVPLDQRVFSITVQPTPATVFGVVTDSATGLPVAGAIVYLAASGQPPSVSTTTDSIGKYQFTFIPVALYQGIMVRHPNYYDSNWQMFKPVQGLTTEKNVTLTPR